MTRTFVHQVRVPYAHVDQMGVVYYSHYLVYFEMARTEMLREIGLPYTGLEAGGLMLPVVEAHCEYRRPARYDDLLEVQSRCSVKGARLRIDYTVTRGGEPVATGHTVHVCLGKDGKVHRPPPAFGPLCDAPETAPGAPPAPGRG